MTSARTAFRHSRDRVTHIPSAFRAIQLDETDQAIHLPLGARIDLGGIAKGWIAEQAALLLSEYAERVRGECGRRYFHGGSAGR